MRSWSQTVVADCAGHMTMMGSLRIIDLHALLWDLVLEPFLKNKITDVYVCVHTCCESHQITSFLPFLNDLSIRR